MTITPKQAQVQLQRIADPRALRRVVTNAFRRSANGIRKDAIARLRGRGIGRRLFGSKKFKQKDALIKVGRARAKGDDVALEISARGIAAIQETGGRFAPHDIKPGGFQINGVPVLVFRVPGRLVVTPNLVKHPGATHPRMPALEPAIEKGKPAVTREILAAVDGHINQALRS